ncbi:F-box/kelch-repeat protein-like protein [Tanacetum coccineum]|uniref:F-box/kelch-repeat protein-like protein n=1 Tax=Tanacetum coccineum TaxID=301880 RepID=A0ABQ5BI72_9ASTR
MKNHELRDIFVLHLGDQLLLDSERGNMEGVEYRNPGPRIVGSCNGILCMENKGRINLWNFSVRRKLTLPSYPSFRGSKKEPYVAFGFGFDSITDDYKIVRISYSKDKDIFDNINACIYSLKTDSWNVIASPTSLLGFVDRNACFFNGTLHWVVYSKYGDRQSLSIMTFSLTTHVFGSFEFPQYSGRFEHVHRELKIINGSLALTSQSPKEDTCIWVMREYANVETWSEIYILETEKLDQAKVLQPITNGDLLIYDARCFDQCYVYNRKIRLLKIYLEFESLKFQDVKSDFIVMERYVESLELLDRGIRCGETRLLLVEKDES